MKRDSKKKSAKTTKERTWSLKRNVKPAPKKETWRILKKRLKKSSSWNYKMRKLRRFWNVKTKRKWLFYFNGVYLFILFRRKVNNTDKGDGYLTEEVLQDEYLSFFRWKWTVFKCRSWAWLGLEFAWVWWVFSEPISSKTTLYIGHIIIKISKMAVKNFTTVDFLLAHFIKTYERVLNGKVMASTMSFSNVFIWFKTLEIWQVTFHGLARGT